MAGNHSLVELANHCPTAAAAAAMAARQVACTHCSYCFHCIILQDPFGAGMRISTRYAYLGGKVCAWLQIPEPTSGTIFGMYLIDIHPKGECKLQQCCTKQTSQL
jgi:hypothetical protein